MEPDTFVDHEMVFLLKGQQGSPFILRARHSLDRPNAPWHLRYLGQPEVGDKSRHALVRNCVDVAVSHNLTEFLSEMGFRMDHEFVAKGHIFRKGALKVVVCKLYRLLLPGNTESTENLSLSNLVELSMLAPAGQDTVSDDMRNFAEQLKPLVHLEKIDPKRLM
ncbi:MED18 polymerase, partial [Polypterus senegalus]